MEEFLVLLHHRKFWLQPLAAGRRSQANTEGRLPHQIHQFLFRRLRSPWGIVAPPFSTAELFHPFGSEKPKGNFLGFLFVPGIASKNTEFTDASAADSHVRVETHVGKTTRMPKQGTPYQAPHESRRLVPERYPFRFYQSCLELAQMPVDLN